MLDQGIEGVLRAGGVEPARRRPPREGPLVGPDQGHGHPDHGVARARHRSVTTDARRRPTRASTSAYARPAARGPAPSRWSWPSRSSVAWARTAARRRRRSRFRAGALPTALPTAYATPGGPWSSRRAVRSHSGPAWRRRPPARAWKLARWLTRRIRRRAGTGPGSSGRAGRPARRACASGPGTRASSSVSGCWADRCASRMASSEEQTLAGPVGGRRRGGRAAQGRAGPRRPEMLPPDLGLRQRAAS